MLRLMDRVIKGVANVTIGSVIVLIHVAIADRHSARRPAPRLEQPQQRDRASA